LLALLKVARLEVYLFLPLRRWTNYWKTN